MAFRGGSRGRAMGRRPQVPGRFQHDFHGNQERPLDRPSMNQYFPHQGPADFYPPYFQNPEGFRNDWDSYSGYSNNMPFPRPPFGDRYYSHYVEDQATFWVPPANIGSRDASAPTSAWHPPTNQERYTLFETMLMCGNKMPGKKTYLAIYWLEFSDLDAPLTSPLFENDPSGHAEHHLQEHLTRQMDVVQRERLKSVTIMQNASPCSRCAEDYVKALGDHLRGDQGIQITIVFSALHWLRRLSCRHDNHQHKSISKYLHEENREGLHELCRTGITVRTTGYEDWRRLSTALQVPLPRALQSEYNYRCSPRGQEDDRLRGDLQEILP